MAIDWQLRILLEGGIKVWNEWRSNNPSVLIDLFQAELDGADITRANLSNANLQEANIVAAHLGETILNGANLRNSDLSGTYLTGADLREANLSGCDLSNTTLSEAILDRAVFSRATVSNTRFESNDITKIIGLEQVYHRGPSPIGKETFQKSRGKISEVFLRGCGLSDWEIESTKLYNPDLSNEEINQTLYKMYDLRAGKAFQIASLFISYSHADSIFVDKLEKYLDEMGVRYWRDIHDAKAGRLEKQIDRAMRHQPNCSTNSLRTFDSERLG